MVTGDAADDAVARARAMPMLGVGLHLVLVDGRPALSPELVPLLVSGDGRFRNDMARAGLTIFARPAARRQLAAEIEAQFAAFAATGLRLDHVNAHKHFHVHPTIAATVLRTGRRYGMRAIRAPVERGAGAMRLIAELSARRFRRAGMTVPDRVVGLTWSGALDTGRMRRSLAALPDGLTEIYTHPATDDHYDGHAPGYRYRDELAALTDGKAMELLHAGRVVTGSFANFTD